MSAAKLAINCHGSPYMPINLKGVLQRYGLSQTDWANAVTQTSGQPLSHSAATMLLNWNTWPKKTPADAIRRQTEAWLRERGVLEEDLAGIWDEDDQDRFRMAHPAGVHIGKGPRHNDEPAIDPIGEPEMLYPETKKHFGLFRDPFRDDVQGAQDVFLSPDQRYIREAMFTTAKHGGFLAVIGESGSGKTTLFNDLYERIETEKAKVIVATPAVVDLDLDSMKTRLTARRMLESLLSVVSSERPRQSIQRLTDQVKHALAETTSGESGHSVVLMVEEAHSLMPATLKMLKRLLEFKAGHRYLLGVILIGQPELAELLDESRHPELREVIRRCEVARLMPLDANLEAYLAHKLQRKGVNPEAILAQDAYDAIRQRLIRHHGKSVVSQLYPLVVNNLVVKAMNHAAAIGEDTVSADVIRAL